VGKPEVTIQLGRPGPRRKDNIKKDLQEVGWGGMDWTDLAQDRGTWQGRMNELMNPQVPQNTVNLTR
jgi:hypothetical protein